METFVDETNSPTAASLVERQQNERKVPRRRVVNRKKAKAYLLPANERDRLRAALHDGLGQLLTSISFLATSLRLNLLAKGLPEADAAGEILSLTSRAISETQALVQDDSPATPPG